MEAHTHVTLTDYEFTLTELEDFIHEARKVDGIAHNAKVTVSLDSTFARGEFTLKASTTYREKS